MKLFHVLKDSEETVKESGSCYFLKKIFLRQLKKCKGNQRLGWKPKYEKNFLVAWVLLTAHLNEALEMPCTLKNI